MERPLIWVERGSLEYQLFLQRLDDNMQEEPKVRKLVCVQCWGFLEVKEKSQHLDHKDFVLPTHYIQNEPSFLQLAQDYKKIDGYMIAILNNKCVFSDALGQGDETSNYSVVPQIRDAPLMNGLNYPIYTNST